MAKEEGFTGGEEKKISWINDVLKSAEENASPEVIKVIEGCGKGCAIQNGHIEGVAPLKEAAAACKTRADYYAFMKSTFPFDVEEADDGIIIRFHKENCTCPMAPEVASPMLCNCTLGHEKAMWSELFGKPVDVDIVESFLRGGRDCVFKLHL